MKFGVIRWGYKESLMKYEVVSRVYRDGLYQVTLRNAKGLELTGFSLNSFTAAEKGAREGIDPL